MKHFICVITLVLLCSASPVQARQHGKSYTITAHSGAYGTPDNSMEFINMALQQGDEILEFDVRCRPDGSLAMSHDKIRSNSDGIDIAKVLSTIKGHPTRVNMDIKENRALPALYSVICSLGMQQQVFMTGVEEEDVEQTKAECPGIEYFLNCTPDTASLKTKEGRAKLLQTLAASGAKGINCSYKYATRQLVKLLHAHGYQLSLWTINELADMQKYTKLHPDNITTRHPDLLRQLKN